MSGGVYNPVKRPVLYDSSGNPIDLDTGGQVGLKVQIVGDGDKYVRGVADDGDADDGIEPVLIGTSDGDYIRKAYSTQRGEKYPISVEVVDLQGDQVTDFGSTITFNDGAGGTTFKKLYESFLSIQTSVAKIEGKRNAAEVSTSYTTLTTTTETEISIDPNSIWDLASAICINTSATGVRIDFRDSPGGTVRVAMYAPATDDRGSNWPFPIPQLGKGRWTATLSGAVTDVRLFAQFIRR